MLIKLNKRAARASLAAAFSLGLSVALLVALQSPAAYAESTQPADPQPQADALEPGLAEDPRKLSNCLVGAADISAEASVWYPMKLEYFQKKSTSVLVLAWMRPGADEGEEEAIEA